MSVGIVLSGGEYVNILWKNGANSLEVILIHFKEDFIKKIYEKMWSKTYDVYKYVLIDNISV